MEWNAAIKALKKSKNKMMRPSLFFFISISPPYSHFCRSRGKRYMEYFVKTRQAGEEKLVAHPAIPFIST
ncbi:hypothetical protein, partial [Bacillus cereus]|uniref:hypothetical protein n=1 Tax=Bacillus cereus TaxID=1396 RepID=UPI0020C035F2